MNKEVDIQVHISDKDHTYAIGATVIYAEGDKRESIDDMVALIKQNFVDDHFDVEVIES